MHLMPRTVLVLALFAAGLSPGVASACCPSGGVGTPRPDTKAPQPSSPSTTQQADAAGDAVVRIGDLELVIRRDFSFVVRKATQG